MNIYITEIDSGNKIQLPVAPTEVPWSSEGRFISYDLMKKGTVNIPEGRQLKKVSWEGIFVGQARRNEPWVTTWTDPQVLDAQFMNWLIDQPALKLVITDSNVNIDCYLTSYSGKPTGGFGDYSYSVTFEEKDDPQIVVVSPKTVVNKSTTTTRQTPATSSTYTIKQGDTLWAIAQKVWNKGSRWNELYNANQQVLEDAAKKHGQKSSNKGNLIYAGTTIRIP